MSFDDLGLLASNAFDSQPRRSARQYRPAQPPRPFWSGVTHRAEEGDNRLAERVAREEALIQGALVDRHRQVEALLGRTVPRSMMMQGQDGETGAGALSDAAYEARLAALRREFPDQLAAIETRDEMIARLSGSSPIQRYTTPQGEAWATTTRSGGVILSLQDGRTGPLSAFPGARPVYRSTTPQAPTRPLKDIPTAQARERSLGERLADTAEDAAQTGPWMSAWRWLATRGPSHYELEDPDTGERIRFASLGQEVAETERERRQAYAMISQSDSWNDGDASFLHKVARGAATLSGTFAGSGADPTSLIAPGRTVATRIAGAVGTNLALDVGAQGADIGAGIEDELDPVRAVLAGAVGGAVQGGFEIGSALRSAARIDNPVPEFDGAAMDAGPLIGDTNPAARAALHRIDQERMDAARLGPIDGPAYDDGIQALNAFRAPPRPDIEREIDDLFGGAAQRQAAKGEATVATYRGRRIELQSLDPMTLSAGEAPRPLRGSGLADADTGLVDATGWNPALAGRAVVFQDRAGALSVLDGRRRLDLARRLTEQGETGVRQDGFVLRQADGWTEADARTLAALRDLREAAGTALDAARLFREAAHLIDDRSLPVAGDLIDQARALARLTPYAFSAVERGVVPSRVAVVVGDLMADRPDLHRPAIDLMKQAKPASLDDAYALVSEFRLADMAIEAGLTREVFGAKPTRPLLIGRAQLRAAVLKAMRSEPGLVASLGRHADAIEAGGKASPRTEDEARVARDLVAAGALEKLTWSRLGEANVYADTAASIRRGDLSLEQGAARLVDELRAGARAIDEADADRAVRLDPTPPSPEATAALAPFNAAGGEGQRGQIAPKPEDVDAEAKAAAEWDDLPEVGEEERALEVLRACAPGRA